MVQVIKNLPANAGDKKDGGSNSGLGRSLGKGKWQPTSVFLFGKSHGWRSLAGYIVHGVAKSQTQLVRMHVQNKTTENKETTTKNN